MDTSCAVLSLKHMNVENHREIIIHQTNQGTRDKLISIKHCYINELSCLITQTKYQVIIHLENHKVSEKYSFYNSAFVNNEQ